MYLSFTVEKTNIAKYRSSNGVIAAVKCFSKKFEKDQNMVRDWVKAYSKEQWSKCTLTEIGGDLMVTKLPSKQQGRLFLLGEKVERFKPSSMLCVTTEQWVNTSITVATAK